MLGMSYCIVETLFAVNTKTNEIKACPKQLQQDLEWLSCMKTLKNWQSEQVFRLVRIDVNDSTQKLNSTRIAELQFLRTRFDKDEYKQLLRWKTYPVNLTFDSIFAVMAIESGERWYILRRCIALYSFYRLSESS